MTLELENNHSVVRPAVGSGGYKEGIVCVGMGRGGVWV